LFSSGALPPLSDVITAGVDMIKDGELITNGAASLYRAAVGLALAILVGGLLGIAMAWWKPVNVLACPACRDFLPAAEIGAHPGNGDLARLR
jgi:NitT/TauT family transport system permease protein